MVKNFIQTIEWITKGKIYMVFRLNAGAVRPLLFELIKQKKRKKNTETNNRFGKQQSPLRNKKKRTHRYPS